MMTNHQYNLKWNDHQGQILHAFTTSLQSENYVDVTLVCEECSIRAHKIVLSACSPYFQRIFNEHPCQHPVIVLKDVPGWVIQAAIEFMYKGEVSVAEDQLSEFIKAAESLKIRGLTGVYSDREHDHQSIVNEDSLLLVNNKIPSCENSQCSAKDNISHNAVRRKQARPRRFEDLSSLQNISSNLAYLPDDIKRESMITSDNLLDKTDVNTEMDDGSDDVNMTACPVSDQEHPKENSLNSKHLQSMDLSLQSSPNISHVSPTLAESSNFIGGIPMFSAPRGGPPRHWSNENLTEALKNVWSGKMKTAQASRVFGIPYNSLLMYVRGKYGKSLKLDLIRKGKIPPYMAHETFSPRYGVLGTSGNLGVVHQNTNSIDKIAESKPLNMVLHEGKQHDMRNYARNLGNQFSHHRSDPIPLSLVSHLYSGDLRHDSDMKTDEESMKEDMSSKANVRIKSSDHNSYQDDLENNSFDEKNQSI